MNVQTSHHFVFRAEHGAHAADTRVFAASLRLGSIGWGAWGGLEGSDDATAGMGSMVDKGECDML